MLVELPQELFQMCASFTEPAAWHGGRAVCKIFRETIDKVMATPEAVHKTLVHMRFEQQSCSWPLYWCSEGRAPEINLAQQSFGLPPEPPDGYPDNVEMFYGEHPSFPIVPFAQFTTSLMLRLMGLMQRKITAYRFEPTNASPATFGILEHGFQRMTCPEDIDLWIGDWTVNGVLESPEDHSPADFALWNLLRMQLCLMTKEYNFLTFFMDHDEMDDLHALMLRALLWERK